MGRIDEVKRLVEEMRNQNSEDGRTLGQVARESAEDMREDSAAAVMVNTALAMNWRWETHAKPRIERFKAQYPNVTSLSGLKALLDSMSERDFCRKVLGISGAKPSNPRYKMLRNLVTGFLAFKNKNGFKDDWETIQRWGKHVNLNDLAHDPVVGRMERVGPATVQNIKLVAGFDTSKPDRRVENVLKHLKLNSPVHIIELVSELTGYRCIELDQLFWHWDEKRQSNGSSNSS